MPNLPLSYKCCGCASCVDACPKGALSLKEDKRCFYNISIDSNKCVECKLCEKQCHILHPERLRKSDPKKVRPLAAWSTNEELIKHSATGAIFAQVAYNMLLGGNTYVFGAALQDDNSVKHIEISNIKELRKLQNSKYQQSNCVGVYSLAKKRLKEGAFVLFSGVPCQIAALYSFLDNREELVKNLYTIEVLCHGVPCNDIHRTAIKANKALRIFAYRNKDGVGWCGGNRVSYIDRNGKRFIIDSHISDSLFRSYLTFNFSRPNCYHCPYAEIQRVADLTIGDFWGWDYTPTPDKYRNYWGTSIVLPNTNKGRIMMSCPEFKCVDTTWKEFLPINQNLYMPTNHYDFKGYKFMQLIRLLPNCIKNMIYQNGFSNPRLNHLYNIPFNILCKKRRKDALDVQTAESKRILEILKDES